MVKRPKLTNEEAEIVRKNIIIDLANINDYISIPDLCRLKKEDIYFQFVSNYFRNEKFLNLTETNKVKSKLGKHQTTVYKLKPDLDNLLAIFDFLKDKKYQKELMETEYYKSLIPDIKHKMKKIFQINWNIKGFRVFGDLALKSPTYINFLLIVNEDNFKDCLAEIKPPKSILQHDVEKKLGSLVMITYGLTFMDALDGTLEKPNKEPKSQT